MELGRWEEAARGTEIGSQGMLGLFEECRPHRVTGHRV